MKFLSKQVTIASLVFLGFACSPAKVQETEKGLKDFYADGFLIGTALNLDQINGIDVRGVDITKQHFNAITPENHTKWELIQPVEGEFDFEAADAFVAFGEANGMHMVGHTLVWHSQTPRWVFQNAEGNLVDRETLIERMRTHIHTVVGRYKGKIHAWDVVNEAVNDDGTIRETLWYRIIGKEYLTLAFQFAREADPDVILVYNDYSLEIPEKRAATVELVKYVRENGGEVDAVGTQGHFSLDWPDLAWIEQTVLDFADIGVDVMITELDIDVLPPAFDYMGADVNMRAELNETLNPYADGLPQEVQDQLSERYRSIFEIYWNHRDKISRVTFWGVTDADSWKNNWPVVGRTNYTLIFDRDGQPKPAFHAISEIPFR